MLALKVENLSKTYQGNVVALESVSLQVEQGDFFGLLGPNGAGKTTIIGIITSLVNKTSGKITIFDIDIDENFPLAKTNLGVVPQEFNFNMFETPRQILVTQAGYYGVPKKLAEERAQEYLTRLGLWEKRKQIARNLSGGMKRRLMIARALMHEPRLLILDEPTAGVDIELRRSMWDFLQEINSKGVTVILTTHYLEEAESLCRNIAIIDKGKIIENTSTKTLLNKLHTETFILDLKKPISTLPSLNGFKTLLIDPMTLAVDIDKSQSVNHLFAELSQQQIEITSMRNKTNRLEELFINLVSPQGK